MKIIKPGFEMPFEDLTDPAYTARVMKKLETIGRTCYKSEAQITEESSAKFVRNLISRGHEAMLEHVSMSVKFIVDRGVSHELVRHRLASFAQESTRYCNYSKDKFGGEVTYIKPCYIADDEYANKMWHEVMIDAENAYLGMLKCGKTPQEARAVLPNSLKTEIWVTTNLREFRHILNLRAVGTTGKPHPQMVEVMVPLLKHMKQYLPDVFFDIEVPE